MKGQDRRLQEDLDRTSQILWHPGRHLDPQATVSGEQGHRRPNHLRQADGQGAQKGRDSSAHDIHSALGVEAGVPRTGQMPDPAAKVAPDPDLNHRRLLLDVADMQGGIVLPVPGLHAAALALGVFEDQHLAGAVLLDDPGGDGDTLHHRVPGRQLVLVVHQEKDAVQTDLTADLSFETLHTDFLSRGHAVLLASGLNNGVQRKNLPQAILRPGQDPPRIQVG